MKLTEFKALTFDCYGTLIDWESGIIAGLKPLTACVSPGPSRNEILEAHAFHESTQTTLDTGLPLLRIVANRVQAFGRRNGRFR